MKQNLPTAIEIATLIRHKQRTAESVARDCLDRIEAQDPYTRAFLDVDTDAALAEARLRDRQNSQGPLHGVPVAIKEVVDVAGLRCSWGTDVYRDRIPQSDAVVVRKLREAGAVIIGTTISTEYAIGAAGPTRNPAGACRSPGGSSSGSAAAVAAGLVPIAIASQTIGSIIRPATYCGIFGLKPTKDAVSTTGTMMMSEHLDHIGPMATNLADLALTCRMIYQPGTAFGPDTPDQRDASRKRLAGLKILRVEGPARNRVQPETRAAMDRATAGFAKLGHEVQELDLPPEFDACQEIIETILYKDLWTHYGEDYDLYRELLSQRMQDILLEGSQISNAAHRSALKAAAALRQTAQTLFRGTVVMSPATDSVAPLIAEGTGSNAQQALCTLLGFPALAVPCGKVAGLPVGVQLCGVAGTDSLLLQTADSLVSALTMGGLLDAS